jgi:hypothetical protein
MAVDAETRPPVALTVTVDEPCAVLDAVRVNVVVHEPRQLEGENVAVTPLGSPEAENAGPALTANAVIVLFTDPPGTTERAAGLAVRVMLGAEAEWYSKDPRS